MASNAPLSTKLVRIGASLLVVGLASIGLTLWVTWQLEGGAAAVNEAGRMRMQTWRLTSAVQAGEPQSRIDALVAEFDTSLALLRDGDPGRPLFLPGDETVTERFEQVSGLWQLQRGRWAGDEIWEVHESMAAADAFVAAIDRLVLAIERQLSRLTAVLNLFQLVLMGLAIGAAVIMLYTGYQYVINPLEHLRRGLRELEARRFGTRIEVDSPDEFGQVAAGFNHLAGTLQSLYDGLEAQVQAKTQRIEAQRARLEALYEVSAFLAQAGNMDDMSRGFSSRVRVVMKADAVAVRWFDETHQRFLMLASDRVPDAMMADERSLAAGSCACASLQPDARTRIIPIHQAQAAPLGHCARHGYRYLVNVPVRLQQRLLGEINLFYREPVELSVEERDLIDALASHLASALEGVRAAALEREAAVGGERALLARELHDSIAQSLAFLKIQVQLLRGAINKGQPDRVQSSLDELDQGLRESIQDVRELLVHFRTRTSTDDMEPALQETLQKFQHQTSLATHLQVDGDGLPLPPDVQIQVLHVIQEALSNVRKHAQATRVSVECIKGQCWRFVVRDDGIGFDPGVLPDETHVGLKIMRERAQRIGAALRIQSAAGEGASITMELPPYPVAGLGDVAVAGPVGIGEAAGASPGEGAR
ncbi:MAG: type IV pili methyl-accepting chemotaxis transducer N-terminal domain-containing protein [Burkholderiaceae bacterium]